MLLPMSNCEHQAIRLFFYVYTVIVLSIYLVFLFTYQYLRLRSEHLHEFKNLIYHIYLKRLRNFIH